MFYLEVVLSAHALLIMLRGVCKACQPSAVNHAVGEGRKYALFDQSNPHEGFEKWDLEMAEMWFYTVIQMIKEARFDELDALVVDFKFVPCDESDPDPFKEDGAVCRQFLDLFAQVWDWYVGWRELALPYLVQYLEEVEKRKTAFFSAQDALLQTLGGHRKVASTFSGLDYEELELAKFCQYDETVAMVVYASHR